MGNELREMMTRLEEDKNLEAEERARLEDEINSKKGEVEDVVAEVKRKEEENKQLQQEMDDARKRQEEASQALIAATTTPKHHHLQVAPYWKKFPGLADTEDNFRSSKVLLEVGYNDTDFEQLLNFEGLITALSLL